MIRVVDIHKRFGRVRAVRGVSFEIPRGQVVGLLGANGAGKTTTIRVITGFLPPDRGTVTIDGRDVVEHSLETRRRVGYLPESAPAYGEMLVRDFLAFRGRLFGLGGQARRAAVDRVLGLCQLRDVRGRRVGHLSKGYRQRVGLAAALLHDPPVLVLDEPTNGLDPTQIREARSFIRELAKDRAVLVSSHILPEVEMMSDRVIIMAAGEIRADEATARLGGSESCIAQIRPSETGGMDGVLTTLRRAVGEGGRIEILIGNGCEERWVRLRVTGHGDGRDICTVVGEAVSAAGLAIRELRAESRSLERLFMDIVSMRGETGGAAEGPR